MGSLNVGSLNVVDIVILAIFIISILIGFGRGLVSEILSLLVIIAAFVVAILFANSLAVYMTHTAGLMTDQGAAATTGTNTAEAVSYMAVGVSFAILFVVTLFVGMVVKMVLNLMLSATGLGFGNRILGGIFGLVRGYLINLAMIFLVQLSPFASQPWWQHSQYVPKFQPQVIMLANAVSPTLENLKATFGSAVGEMQGTMQNMGNSVEQNMGNAMKEVTPVENQKTPASTQSQSAKPSQSQTKPVKP